jgi:hypothetical protein
MHFQIEKVFRGLEGEPGYRPPLYTWRLVAATGAIARSPESYGSVSLARGSIAQFKRSASGVRYARVQEPQDA